MTRPTQDQDALWRALFRVQGRARKMADDALSEAGLPSLETYDILLELDRAGVQDGLRAKDLESQLLLPQYGVSRLVARLVQQGLIRQIAHPGDKRARLLRITPEGRALRQRMWRVYGPVISGFQDGVLSEDETRLLADLLGKLDQGGVDGHPGRE